MSGSQSLDRGLSVLELLDSATEPLGVREIARQLDLSPAIVQRLIKTLADRNYIKQDADTKRYSVGYRALGLGASLLRTDRLIMAAHGELQKMVAKYSLNAFLGTFQGNRAVYLLSFQSGGPVSIRTEPGETMHLHTTAIGKVLLASLSDDQASVLLGRRPMQKMTDATVTDPRRLLQSLPAVRKAGYSVVKDENIKGVISVGAPIRGSSGRTRAAISVAFAPDFSPNVTVDLAVKLVVGTSARLSADLGFTGE